MLRTQISLIGILFITVYIQTAFVPGIWSPLRIDLFMGMIIGVIVHLGFSQGLAFVLFTSLVLQAFSGARPGLIPMVYLCTFVAMGLLKGVIYLENIMTQVLLAVTFYIIMTMSLAISLDVNPSPPELTAMAAGAVFSGCLSPLMVELVGRLKKAHEA